MLQVGSFEVIITPILEARDNLACKLLDFNWMIPLEQWKKNSCLVPSKIEGDVTEGPLSKLLHLLDTQV